MINQDKPVAGSTWAIMTTTWETEYGTWFYSNVTLRIRNKFKPGGTTMSKITSLVVESATDTEVELKWLFPFTDVDVASYDFRYRTGTPLTALNFGASTQATGEPTPTFFGDQQRITISGLSSGTQYWFGLKSISIGGTTSSLSNVASTTTL